MVEEDQEKMKLNEPEKQKLHRQNSLWQVKHAEQDSDRLQAIKRKPGRSKFLCIESFNFCVRSTQP